jgi:ribose transport system permease protein
MSILLGVLVLGAVLSVLEPAFFSLNNYKNILLQASFTGVIAVGMTFVIMTGGIDISVGMSVFFLMAVMARLALREILPPPLIFAVGLLGGLLVGVFNGFLISVLRIVPLIATLATLTICRGIAYILIQSKLRYAPEPIRIIGLHRVFGVIPLPILILLGMVIIGAFLKKYTRFGRYVLAIGNSVISARETGLPIYKIRFAAYAFCGLCAGIAAVIYIGRLGIVQTDTGYGTEFTVITAVVLGGARLSGGRGSVVGAAIGCVFLMLIENALSLLEVSGFYYDVVRGTILFIAVVIERVSTLRQERMVVAERVSRLRGTS